jgi:hypothetical protein
MARRGTDFASPVRYFLGVGEFLYVIWDEARGPVEEGACCSGWGVIGNWGFLVAPGV